jgi:hypothetical protein
VKRVYLWWGVGILCFAGLLISGFRHLNSARIVAEAMAPNGVEFIVVQKCNWGWEMFTTSCYYRKPGGPWGWFYYDHEDSYWGSAKVETDTGNQEIRVYRGGKLAASFNWKTETFTLVRSPRTLVGAQYWLSAGQHPVDRK